MADQTVRIENLPDTESGSPARVAYDLTIKIMAKVGGYGTKDAILDLYAECLSATKDRRG